jgi:uridylate kinase
VDGVYDKDPNVFPDAVLRGGLSYQQVLDERLNVMDATSITLCRENDIPVVVFNMAPAGNINRALRGKVVGTCVSHHSHDARVG